MRSLLQKTFLAPLFVIAGACGQTVGLQVQAVTGSGEAVSAGDSVSDDAQTPLTISSLQVHLRDIRLSLPDGSSCKDVVLPAGAACDDDQFDDNPNSDPTDEDTIVIDGPFVLDLASGQSTPDLTTVQLPAGTYKRIDLRIEDGDPSEGIIEAGSALDDRSFAGSFALDFQGSPVTLQVSLRFNEDIRIEDPAGIAVEGDASTLLAGFNVSDWFLGLDITDCIDRGELVVNNGEILVDEDALSGSGACSDIENILKDNIKNSGQLDRE